MKSLQIVAAAGVVAAYAPAVHMPLHLNFGVNEKISTSLYIASANKSIEVVYDSGSENFFLFGPGAIDNWGTSAIGSEGPCNASVPRGSLYDYRNSPTASSPVKHVVTYVYGGADKIYDGEVTVNDTFTFYNDADLERETVPDVRVQLANFLIQRINDPNCTGSQPYDLGILGVSPYYHNTTTADTKGPHFRQDLLERGVIKAAVQSIWFDEAPESVYGTYTGSGLLGGIDTSKYNGDLIKVQTSPPQGYVGYFTAVPNITINGVSFTQPENTEYCQLDSGTHDDTIPIAYTEDTNFYNASGLVLSPKGYVAWPGECDAVPRNLTFDYTFPSINAGKEVTIKVPVRAYVRVDYSKLDPGYCIMSVSTSGCLLGAPFASASFFAADDETGEIALAQGGVSKRGASVDQDKVVLRIP